jgi:succinate dehydrogenase / fumarate reductase flavoprotein subunit
MQRLVGIFRVEADLHEAISELAKLKARWPGVGVRGGRTFNPGWNLVFELRNLLVVSEAITRSALQRTESRGAHSRIDYPETDQPGWAGRNSVVRRRGDGAMDVTTTALPEMPKALGRLLGSAH